MVAGQATREELLRARVDLDDFRTRLSTAHPELRLRGVAPAEEIALPRSFRGGALVEFVVGEHHTIAFAAAGSDLAVRTIAISQKRLTARVESLTRRIRQRDFAYGKEARDLYRLLLGPLEPMISRRRLLCVIPDGILWRVPFQVLRGPDGKALVESTALVYAPSLAVLRLAESRPHQTRSGELLAMGNPTYGAAAVARARSLKVDMEMGALPDAETEVHELGRIYRGPNTIAVRGEARESLFKEVAGLYRVLHLATHGIVDERSPMYSALVLAAAPEDRDDGLLEARELMSLTLHADVAVLSACDSGSGGMRPGEGVVGLSWAFLVAGCPTTVVSR